MTNEQKRELLKRLRFEAGVMEANGLHHETVLEAVDYIESTLPPLRRSGEVLRLMLHKHNLEPTRRDHCKGGRVSELLEAAALALGIQPQEQP